jgi:DNA-binding CsgD family transcriptional regulator
VKVVARGASQGAAKLRDDLLQVTQVQGPDELLRQCIEFTQRLGFQTVAAMAVFDQSGGPADFHALHNSPASYNDEFNDVEQGRRCPVMQHCKRSALPIAWNQHTYTAAGLGPMWESQAAHGFAAGIAVALHLSLGRHFFIGIDRDRPLPAHPAELTRLTAELQLFAVHAQEAALRLMGPHQAATDRAPPTARELEALRWTMEGKTAWEVGRILGISEQTVARHLHNATRKLDAVNKHQAVIKALRLGLLN